ncbi:hypothetical protein CVT24_001658 [Panaeolus cyanescens]|uniref:snRNA-activating protein complex subunit 4 n=1 Tax=Panaeolus cyanescens TaxID=181874 RepID=A0A409VT46_9AGAR|nr:hypothetical protein CVT24_001658 [Panaeolus cyanescens]
MSSPEQTSNQLEDGSTNAKSKDLVQDALKANKTLQQSLARRAEELEAELNELDGLLSVATNAEGNEDPESEVFITGAKKAAGLFPATQFLNLASPFYAEAKARTAYINNTNPRPLKGKDLDLLAEGVKRENERLEAYRRAAAGDSDVGPEIDLKLNVDGIDWERVAQYVSDESSVKRTAMECRICWIGDKHPSINHSEWSEDEVKKVTEIVSEAQKVQTQIDWVAVAKELGTNRRPIDCMKQAFNRPRHSWTPEADQKLLEAVEQCGIDNWHVVATMVSEHVTPSQCQNRWCRTVNPELRRGAWTAEEDELLKKAVAAWGTSWMQIAAHIPGRNNDQCRDRWAEYLSPSSSQAPWTEEEDEKLLEYVAEMKNQWKAIGLKIGNRTGHSCRIRYEKLMRMEKAAGKASGGNGEEVEEGNSEQGSSQVRAKGKNKSSTQPKPRKRAKAVQETTSVPTSQSITPPTDQPRAETPASTTVGTESQDPAADPTSGDTTFPVESGSAATPKPRPKPRPRKKAPAASLSPDDSEVAPSSDGLSPQPSTSGSATKRSVSKGGTRATKRSKLSQSVTVDASENPAESQGPSHPATDEAADETPVATRRSMRVRTATKKG